MDQSVHYTHAHVKLSHAYNCILALASLSRLRNDAPETNTNVLRSAGLAANEQHKTERQTIYRSLIFFALLVQCIWHVKRHRHAALLLLLLLLLLLAFFDQ